MLIKLGSMLLVLWASAAVVSADTHYYVKTTGNDNASGESPASAWQTISRFNSPVHTTPVQPNTAFGTVFLHVDPGDYSGGAFPNPFRTPADGKFYAVVGDSVSPSSVRLPGGVLTKSYLMIKGVHFTGAAGADGDLELGEMARKAFVGYCKMGHFFNNGSDYSHVYRNEISKNVRIGTKNDRTGNVVGFTFVGNRALTMGNHDSGHPFRTGGFDGRHRAFGYEHLRSRMDSSYIAFNQFKIVYTGNTCYDCSAGSYPRWHYFSSYNTFRSNRWEIENNDQLFSNGDSWAFRLRDSCIKNIMVKDTMFLSGTAKLRLGFNPGGHEPCMFPACSVDVNPDTLAADTTWKPGIWPGGPCVDNRYDSLLVVNLTDSNYEWGYGMWRDTLTYCVLLTENSMHIPANKGPSLIDHNTIAVRDPSRGVVRLDNIAQQGAPGWSDTLHFTNNLLYAAPPYVQSDPCTLIATGSHKYALYMDLAGPFDGGTHRRVRSNWNLFGYYGTSTLGRKGDRSIGPVNFNCNCEHCSRPGEQGGVPDWWYATYQQDWASVYGSPDFYDSSLTSANFNGKIGGNSAARGQASNGTDIGAIPYSGSGGCPFVDTHTLSGWTEENSIRGRSLSGAMATDTYLLKAVAEMSRDRYRLRIRENENEVTSLDQIALIAVDRAPGADVFAVDGRGFAGSRVPVPRVMSRSGDITALVNGSGEGFFGEPGDTLLVELGARETFRVARARAMRGDQPVVNGGDPPLDILSGDKNQYSRTPPGPSLMSASGVTQSTDEIVLASSGIMIQVPDGNEGWITVTHHYPREHVDHALFDLPAAADRVRLVFLGQHRVGFIGRAIPTQEAVEVQALALLTAHHSSAGESRAMIAQEDSLGATLAPGDTIELEFAAVPLQPDRVRDLVLISRGVYTSESPMLRGRRIAGPAPSFRFSLEQNRPNPFAANTLIHFSLPTKSNVRLEVFDLLGRRVRILTNGVLAAGPHSVEWDRRNSRGSDAAAGVYVYRLTAGEMRAQTKMVLLR